MSYSRREKYLLGVIKRISKGMYKRVKRLKREEGFENILKQVIMSALRSRYEHLNSYAERANKRGFDVLFPSVELMRVPYKIKFVTAGHNERDVDELLFIMKGIEKELRESVIGGRRV